MAPIALMIIPGRRDSPLCVPAQDFFLAAMGVVLPSGGLGSIYIWPFRLPFETVPVTNGAIQIQLNYTIDLMKSSL